MINLDEQTCLDLLDKAVAERGPEYVYERVPDLRGISDTRCVYVDASTGERQPSCIVGMVLSMAGVPLALLENHEGQGAASVVTMLHRVGYIDTDDYATCLLENAQAMQDQGMTWATARDFAVQTLADYKRWEEQASGH